jgi:hypothetical protein
MFKTVTSVSSNKCIPPLLFLRYAWLASSLANVAWQQATRSGGHTAQVAVALRRKPNKRRSNLAGDACDDGRVLLPSPHSASSLPPHLPLSVPPSLPSPLTAFFPTSVTNGSSSASSASSAREIPCSSYVCVCGSLRDLF